MIIYFAKTREEKTIHIVLRASDLGARLIVTIYYWLSPYNQLIEWIADHHFHNHDWLSFQPALPQIYIFHIYTGPKFTKPTFTQNPDLHKLKFTQLRFTHTQIYTAQYWHTQIYTTQIYTKLNPNLHNPNLQNPNLHKTQIYRFINPWFGKG